MIRSKRILDIAEKPDGTSKFVTVGVKETATVARRPSGDATIGSVVGKSDSMLRQGESTEKTAATKKRVVEAASGGYVEVADGSAPGGVPMTTGSVGATSMLNDVMLEFVTSDNQNRGALEHNKILNRIYRDMFYHDSICGSAVELRSVMPFSEFSLTGIRDEKSLMLFVSACERMNTPTLLPSISVSYDVLGAFVASLSWDEQRNTYNGITPQNIDHIQFTPVPIYGADPLMNLRLDERTIRYLQSTDTRMDRYRKFIPDDLKSFASSSSLGPSSSNPSEASRPSGGGSIQGVPLSPDHTIFIPRRGLDTDYMGVSYFKRAIPAWVVEKALIRGTMDQVYKRQRAVSHITIGDGEQWIPTLAEQQQIAQLFLDADLDPVGALVVTRSGVSVNDVRRGDDFYKWQDAYEQLATIKFRALGISESFISGDAQYSTIEQALSTFMEQIRNHRANITNELFYQKIFPSIAKANNITAKRNRVREVASAGIGRGMFYDEDGNFIVEVGASRPSLEDYNPSDYAIPRVQWHKRLMPEADREYLDLLSELSTKGIPVPLRMLAAAGGIDVRTLIEGKDDDIRLRKEFKDYLDKIKEFSPQPEEGEGGDGEFASVIMGSTGLPRKGILNRDFGEPIYMQNGKRKSISKKGQAVIDERNNKLIAQAASELGMIENRKTKAEYQPKKTYSFKKRS